MKQLTAKQIVELRHLAAQVNNEARKGSRTNNIEAMAHEAKLLNLSNQIKNLMKGISS